MTLQARIVTSDTLNEPGGGLQFHEDDSVQVTRGRPKPEPPPGAQPGASP